MRRKRLRTPDIENALVQIEKNNKVKNFKETFISWSENTDINCYGKIFKYENLFVKLFWLIILLASLSITAWIMSLSIVSYFQYGIVSQIRLVYEKPIEFPAVTFCDNNPFSTQQGQDFLLSFFNGDECQNVTDSDSSYTQWECAFNLAAMKAADPLYPNE